MTDKNEQPQLVWVRRSLLLSQQQQQQRQHSSKGGSSNALFKRSKSLDDNNTGNATMFKTKNAITASSHLFQMRSNGNDTNMSPTLTTTEPTAHRRLRRVDNVVIKGRSSLNYNKSDSFQSTTTTTITTTAMNSGSSSSCSNNSTIATDDVSSSSTSSLSLQLWHSTPYEWVQGMLLSSSSMDEDKTESKNDNNSRMLQIRILPDKQQHTTNVTFNNNDNLITLTVPTSKLHTDVNYANSPNYSKDQQQVVAAPDDDLTTLQHFNEPALVACLQQRFARQLVYTRTGPVLIAVNPFKYLEELYCDATMQQYWRKAEEAEASSLSSSSSSSSPDKPLRPHVYAMADNAFRSMMRAMEMNLDHIRTTKSQQSNKKKLDQSILVSGESGAGKTVTVKYIMKYLAALSQRASRAATSAHRTYPYFSLQNTNTPTELDASSSSSDKPTSFKSCGSIEAQVLQSNPILESFGNARTVRNDNSSRFGKFIEMQFTATGRLIGTQIKTYLLEKVRVVHISPGERNYHIFYQLLVANGAGLSPDQHEQLHLLKANGTCCEPSDFALLSGSGTFVRRDGVLEADTFRDLKKAMSMMGFDEQERMQIFATAAAILHASNIKFEAVPGNQEDICRLEQDNVHLEAVCDLLEVSMTALNEALCYRQIKAAGKSIKSPLDHIKAKKGLDALLKATYGALFTFLVQRVNASIAAKTKPRSIIGVLDIFGFESFAVNSFEQLCINYCNEVLQQQFNAFMLKNEQAEYASEGIDWEVIKFPENQDVLDLLDDRTNGILSILDDMCKAPGATDKSFAIEVVKRCDSMSRFEACYNKSAPLFSIQHYAGTVEYNTECFVEKNRDDLPRETSILLMGSSNPFVHKLAEIIDREHNNVSASGNNAKSSPRPTVGGQFRQQVKELRAKIDSTCPHYVRCIKPNSVLVPDCFDCEMVVNQLRCGGILQAVSVTRDGFTLHYTHAEFLNRYKGLLLASERFVAVSPSSKTSVQKETCALVDELLKRIQVLEMPKGAKDTITRKGKDNNQDASIQFGKSKVLLKHHAFEALEAMLRAHQNKYATRLNAIIRRYLCRAAFLSARECFREELRQKGQTFDEWFKEHRELYYQPRSKKSAGASVHIPNIVRARMEMFRKACSASSPMSRPSSTTKNTKRES